MATSSPQPDSRPSGLSGQGRTKETPVNEVPGVSQARDWSMRADIGQQLQFPREITTTSLWPDIVLWSAAAKSAMLIELTVPWEEGIHAAYEWKAAKYSDQVAECRELVHHHLPFRMIKNVDFHCESNNMAHRTIEITSKQLIVRRGQSFLLTLEMMQPFKNNDVLVLSVETGSAPSEVLGTRCNFGNPSPLYTSDARAIWNYSIDKSANLQLGIVTLSVSPPVDAPVGRYSLSARTTSDKKTLGTLVVLFNPWCSGDWVFLPDEQERQEYVMNEQGVIYYGTAGYPRPMDWVFGQFEEEMVDICLKMLDINPKHTRNPADDVSARCNPIYVGRVVSAMINSNGDQGVLLGRWHDNYVDGVRPTHWTGSVSILQHWYQNNCHPVKYGQCWVFAGVMCTVMRFLGIPCRVVTNFKSAHDKNSSLTIDEYYNEYGLRATGSQDSIWNFHVWVEGWMKRPDLKKEDKYDGWQVLDPTPQELSEGAFCCGPAPVAAIFLGDVDLKYDVPFVFSEVNADIVKWMVSAGGVKIKMHSNTSTVGQNISTKAVGFSIRNDITSNYKHKEGSTKERDAFKRALNRVNSGDDQEGKSRDETLKLEMKFEEAGKMLNGQDIKLSLNLRNKDRTNKTVSIRVTAQAMMYNGIPANNIQSTVQEKTLLPGQAEILPVQIPFSVYGKYTVSCDSVKVSAVAVNKQQEDDIYETETDIVLEDPKVSIKVLSEARLFKAMTMEVEFTNPLNVTLRNCSLTVIGCGLFKSDYIEGNTRELDPKSNLRLRITTTPYKAGLRTVVADFDCSAFRDVKGSCTVDVKA
ncbi:LOW QUALITY PROTEIN: protein-glutamine gamma-glutamyltransferase 2-like [Xyrichtys novacula]|uniref:Protein-glutamine gamma-glutamyltransferase 2 n=1 Tax=Xyrichtys novacula TaxID=13765 RepID=A0AAV1HIU2_XYRNO|nr:LOW QUALITY PROTEIN: protein-glutamine gamma-glutamyltransferase 2-like [Xyrichtys novacula]